MGNQNTKKQEKKTIIIQTNTGNNVTSNSVSANMCDNSSIKSVSQSVTPSVTIVCNPNVSNNATSVVTVDIGDAFSPPYMWSICGIDRIYMWSICDIPRISIVYRSDIYVIYMWEARLGWCGRRWVIECIHVSTLPSFVEPPIVQYCTEFDKA